MDRYQAIRLRALQSVLHPDEAYLIKKILRWYSRSFLMPLSEVEELPFEDIFTAYYEERYEAMSEEDREAERLELLTTPEQRYQKIIAEEAMEAELFETARIIAASEAAKAKAGPEVKKQGDLAEIQHRAGPIVAKMSAESELPAVPAVPEALPQGITMTFVDDAELEAELDMGTLPAKK